MPSSQAKEEKSVDYLIETLGGCGRFQVILNLAVIGAMFSCAFSMLFMVYGKYNPGWTCQNSTLGSSLGSGENAITEAADRTNVSGLVRNTLQSGIGQMRIESGNNSEEVVGPSCDVWRSCEKVVFYDEGTLVSEWNLVCDRQWVPSFIILMQMVGVFTGAYIGGLIGERFGRKFNLYFQVFFLVVFNVTSIFSVSWEMFTALRFLIGLNIGGALASGFVYSLEFITQTWRGNLSAHPVWNVGGVLFASLVIATKNWRHVHALTASIAFLNLLPAIWAPESMRWLAINGHDEKAHQVVRKISRMNKSPMPTTTVLQQVAAAERETHATAPKYTFLHLFTIPQIRKRTIYLSIMWISHSSVYYGISFGIQALSGDFYINFLLFSVTDIAGVLYSPFAMRYLGRRRTGFLHYFGVAIACLVITCVLLTEQTSTTARVVSVLAMIAKMFALTVWEIQNVYSNELYPTVIRSISSGYLGGASRIGSMAAPYLIPAQSDAMWAAFLAMGLMMALSSCLILQCPETLGTPMPDSLESRVEEKQDADLLPPEDSNEIQT